jgi:hypothetical protein
VQVGDMVISATDSDVPWVWSAKLRLCWRYTSAPISLPIGSSSLMGLNAGLTKIA